MEKSRLTRLEIYWVLYDVGNSAFVLLTATLLPIYFDYLAEKGGVSEVDYLAYWGYAASFSTFLVAFLAPVLGALTDARGFKKPVFAACVLAGALGCAALSIPGSWPAFLAVFVVAKVGYSTSLVFYDSMLTDVTEPERMDMVSSQGYAWGYLGSCVPFVVSLGLVLLGGELGISASGAMAGAFVLNAGWWLLMTLPLLKNYRQVHCMERRGREVRQSLSRLAGTLKELRENKSIFMFLAAFFFYIDGVYTIIEMATAYGKSMGLDTQGLLLALLVTQLVAFPCAILFGMAARRFQAAKLIKLCILAYLGIALFAIQLDRQWEFWVLAVFVGMFQGAVQALSRSYFAKIIPPEKSGEYFGIFDICGKGASFMGTALTGMFAQITGKTSGGVAVLAVMFAVGFVLFGKAVRMNEAGGE